ncbi:AAA family ATPase [Rhodopseudomonas palustris]|uniref:AAA family ATPase n=1 Tax=Rhodopseudomonas palustris TaxID=1076 RepID=UPI0021F3C16D|nr:AAA family ATPase [Rhodopseudomonas palustris]UYO55200.1 AAA family ATPase [Rhodopseudomonas palustris]
MSYDNRFASLVKRVIEDRSEFVSDLGETLYDPWRVPYPVLIDVLVAQNYNDALARLMIATKSRYPWISLSRDLITADPHITTSDHLARNLMLNIARRISNDVEGLDILWRLLASHTNNPEHFGFLHRLSDLSAVTTHHRPYDSVVSTSLLDNRINRIESIAGGLDAHNFNVIDAIQDDLWERLVEADNKLRMKKREEALAIIEAKEALGRDNEQFDEEAEFGNRRPLDMVQVVPERSSKIPFVSVEWLSSHPVPIVRAPADVAAVSAQLRAEYPHAGEQIARLMSDIRGDDNVQLRPTLIVGSPGTGKSRVVRRLSELLGVPIRRYDAAGSIDASFSGTSKQWSSARTSVPLTAVAELRVANPIVMIDEIDKAATSRQNGALDQALLPFLERETSRRYPDPGIEIEVDLSHVSYVATANLEVGIPQHLLDRFRIVRWPDPTVDMVPDLVRSLLSDVANDQRIDPRFIEPFSADELDVVTRAWVRGRPSIRRLQVIVRATLTAREQHALRH